MVKNPPASVEDIRDVGLIPESGLSPGGGHSNPLQYSCLENPIDRGAQWATVHRVAKSRTWLKLLSMHACNQNLPTPRTGNESLSYEQGCCGEEGGYWKQRDSLRKEGRTKTDVKREARRLEVQPQVHWKKLLAYSTCLIASYKTLTDVC